MTGPEHYREAEHLLSVASNAMEWDAAHVERAKVHALLAIAAATALNQADAGMWTLDFEAWREAAAVQPQAE